VISITTIQRIWRLRSTLLHLRATRCLDCGYVSFPPKAACPKCGSRNIVREELPKEGKVLTYTVLNVPIKGFEDHTPLIVALIQLGDAKVLAQLTDVSPEDVRLGMKVVSTVRRTAPTLDGVVPYVVKFRPKEKIREESTTIKPPLKDKDNKTRNLKV